MGVKDALWTSACPACGGPLDGTDVLCSPCRDSIRSLSGVRCARCSVLLSRSDGPLEYREGGCVACRTLPTGISARIIAAEYTSIRDIFVAFKYERNRFVGNVLAERLGATLRDHPLAREFEVVVPVPLHRPRLRERGFNQSDVLAQASARALGIPCILDAVRRFRKTEQQAKLRRRSERAANVAGAFTVDRPEAIRGRRVLLVDDVITTGATVGACADALRTSGATDVFAAALAHPFHTIDGDQVDIRRYPL